MGWSGQPGGLCPRDPDGHRRRDGGRLTLGSAVPTGSLPSPLIQQLPEHRRLAVFRIARSEDERHAPSTDSFEQRRQGWSRIALRELPPVTQAELVPALEAMPVPPSQFVAGRDRGEPFVQLESGAADTAWPDAVDKHAVSVYAPRRVVGTTHPHPTAHVFIFFDHRPEKRRRDADARCAHGHSAGRRCATAKPSVVPQSPRRSEVEASSISGRAPGATTSPTAGSSSTTTMPCRPSRGSLPSAVTVHASGGSVHCAYRTQCERPASAPTIAPRVV